MTDDPAAAPLRMQRRDGLYAAPFTPFREDGSVAFDMIPALAAHLARSGLTGAFVCGSNGEGPSLSTAERRDLAEAWTAAAAPGFEIMVHVGHSSIREAQGLAEHAERIGASAASAVAAFYFRPDGVGALVDSMAEIARAAPGLPFFYYHIPALTAVSLDVVGFLERADGRIANLAGVKYTAPTLWEYQACLDACDGAYDVMFGLDEMLLPALAVGARSAIGSTYNFAAPLYLEVLRLFREGRIEDARSAMGRLVAMVRILLSFPAIPAQREIMRVLGFDHGECRLPLGRLDAAAAAELYRRLEAIGFWANLEMTR